MSNTTNYSNAPSDIEKSLVETNIISDFLPSPSELTIKTEKEKITIALDKQSLDLFKKYAKEHNTKYQPMINDIIRVYADKFLKTK